MYILTLFDSIKISISNAVSSKNFRVSASSNYLKKLVFFAKLLLGAQGPQFITKSFEFNQVFCFKNLNLAIFPAFESNFLRSELALECYFFL